MTRSRLNFFSELPFSLPCSARIERKRKARLSIVLQRALDRVNVLGEDGQECHTGCVNALSWAQGGDLLISGGDDTTVRIWKMDTSDTTQAYPFTTSCVIRTGHRANIFSAQMLPRSSRIASAAGDKEVRVFDIKGSLPVSRLDQEAELFVKLRCHTDRVKRIVTEDSPDLFLTVSEDGTVRQHDLRTSHNCGRNSCPTPLVEHEQELCTLSLSPLTPYQFVVAGVGPFGFLYDRRHSSRAIEARWGGLPRTGEEITTCVRKFGRKSNDETVGRLHITGARMSTSNGHEVLLSYTGDAVYLFSTVDEPFSRENANPSVILPPNDNLSHSTNPDEVDEDTIVSGEPGRAMNDDDETLPDVPIILPRRRYAGARNVATVKDVNFLGPNDELVTSGSDDGNFFIWNKLTGTLHGIYEGDSSVVNMVEGHPQLPVIAVSGIDTTVKLFAPSQTSNTFSRLADAESIIETNQRPGRTRVVNLAAFLGTREISLADGTETVTIGIPDCVGQ